jgi:Calcineurin-like phosphoesterase.
MSEYVIVSDIHGNAPALRRVAFEEGFKEKYLVLGDLHGLCAYPTETVQLVKNLGTHVIAGNHDRAIFHENEGHVVSEELSEFELSHTLDNLTPLSMKFMYDLSCLDVVQDSNQRMCLCHAYPWPEQASGYEAGNSGVTKGDVVQIASVVSDDYDWVFHGHTHEQYDLDCSKFGHDVHFINPGSLGYDNTYSVVDVATGEVEHKSVEVEADVSGHIQDALPEDAPHVEEWFQ